jgi:hypothetical protein
LGVIVALGKAVQLGLYFAFKVEIVNAHFNLHLNRHRRRAIFISSHRATVNNIFQKNQKKWRHPSDAS